jgi:hypothetical protein
VKKDNEERGRGSNTHVVGMFRIWFKYILVNPKDLDQKYLYKQ